jgi:hypothetical protein
MLMAFGKSQLHLDRGQCLTDFVVKLARDHAPLIFLGVDQPRGQPLEIARIGENVTMLFTDLRFEATRVARCHERDRQAQNGGDGARPPRSSPHAFVKTRPRAMFGLEGLAIQGANLIRNGEDDFTLGNDTVAEERSHVGRR